MLIVLFVAVLFHFFSIYYSCNEGFFVPISDNILVYSTIDIFLSFFVTFLVLNKYPYIKQKTSWILSSQYVVVFEKNKITLIAVILFAAYLAYLSLQLILLGHFRHELLREYGTGGVGYMAISGFFKLLVPLVFYFGSTKSLKLISILGLLLSILITASRSELSYVINFLLIFLMFTNKKQIKEKIFKVFSFSLFLIFFAILATTFIQNRSISSGFNAFYDIFNNMVQYRTYGYYLADISLKAGEGVDKILFPFFGYISEYFIRFFWQTDLPIDSEFVGQLHYIGESYLTGRPFLANVLYPWWSWFVGYFGIIGLLVKALYVYFLLSFCLSRKLMFTLVLLLSYVLLGTSSAHPLLTLTHTFSFFIAVLIDFAVIYKSRKLIEKH